MREREREERREREFNIEKIFSYALILLHLFTVDASKAGGGILEVAILANKNHVPHTLEDLGKGIYEISFVGQEAVRHRVHLTFNEEYIPGKNSKLTVRRMN